jgi:hypothetical protein
MNETDTVKDLSSGHFAEESAWSFMLNLVRRFGHMPDIPQMERVDA